MQTTSDYLMTYFFGFGISLGEKRGRSRTEAEQKGTVLLTKVDNLLTKVLKVLSIRNSLQIKDLTPIFRQIDKMTKVFLSLYIYLFIIIIIIIIGKYFVNFVRTYLTPYR